MAIINQPPTTPFDMQDSEGRLMAPAEGWRNFVNAAYSICNAMTLSGTTAQRPVTFLWSGRRYMDTTVGLPIFYAGAGVWKNYAGVPV